MENIYHYATVSKALEEKGKGFTYDFNLHEEDIVKNPNSTSTATKEIQTR
jgi:hypothetical protein